MHGGLPLLPPAPLLQRVSLPASPPPLAPEEPETFVEQWREAGPVYQSSLLGAHHCHAASGQEGLPSDMETSSRWVHACSHARPLCRSCSCLTPPPGHWHDTGLTCVRLCLLCRAGVVEATPSTCLSGSSANAITSAADTFKFILFVAHERGLRVPDINLSSDNVKRAWDAIKAYNSRLQNGDADRHVPFDEAAWTEIPQIA